MKRLMIMIMFAIVMAGCTQETNPEATQETQLETTQEAPSQGAVGTTSEGTPQDEFSDADIQDVAVSMDNYSYSQKEIRVKQGVPVKIAVTNTEGVHDFKIDELKVNSGIIPAGETKTVEFTPEQAGRYEYYCSVGNHREMGMVGTLVVE